MAKQELVIIDGELEYVIHERLTDKGLHIELKYSKSQCWSDSVRDTTALEILDDGNGVKIITKLNKQIDYHEVITLSILLNKIVGDSHNIEIIKYKEDDSK